MPRVLAPLLVLAAAVAVAGCSGGDEQAVDAGPGIGEGVVEWRGSLPCADCEAIDTRLVLEHRDGQRRYRLVEVYVALDGSQSFNEAGEWRLDDALLSLEPATGGLRRYALVGGGALQVRDPAGAVFAGREHDLLQPAGRHP